MHPPGPAVVRVRPNILVTGTPGTGKTTLAASLTAALGPPYIHKNISHLVAAHAWHVGYDAKWLSYILDEDALLDALEPDMQPGAIVVDYHGCDFFPERWFDLVVVLRTTTAVLYDRLAERQYPKHKIDENVTSEIMNVVHDEALEAYKRDVVLVLDSNSRADLAANVATVKDHVARYVPRCVPAAPPAPRWEEELEDSDQDVPANGGVVTWPGPVAAHPKRDDDDDHDDGDGDGCVDHGVGAKRKRA
ncbi:adenylate kinase [Synchytrium endobioticum]|uniref:Adenylate kinase isoenzyme 6 homolog n=1 Tax=Synchytrium endobioticum TaxID=286115 RepID=A0A507CUE5_9FUNG|nr:adenylate kinase [Synchytrium endobioticum]TPX47288.1 adenylate kinase [Synchytrium endobioticum]